MPTLTSLTMLEAVAGGLLFLSFFLVGRVRLASMLAWFRAQALLLSVYALMSAVLFSELALMVTAVLIVVLKAWFVPRLLLRTAKRSQASERMPVYLRPTWSLFAAGCLVFLAFFLTNPFVLPDPGSYLIVGTSLSMMFLGLLMLVVQKGMYGQIIGFLLMENGIFTFGLALTGGMPLFVELGIFFDVIVGSVLMAALSYRVQAVHETVTTDRLSELVD